jgi:hypothetical protein
MFFLFKKTFHPNKVYHYTKIKKTIFLIIKSFFSDVMEQILVCSENQKNDKKQEVQNNLW